MAKQIGVTTFHYQPVGDYLQDPATDAAAAMYAGASNSLGFLNERHVINRLIGNCGLRADVWRN